MSSTQKAREQRYGVVRSATMRGAGARSNVCIRNISAHGMMITAALPPDRGSYVEIIVADRSIVARVVWSASDRFGVRTREKLDLGIFAEAGKPIRTGAVERPAQMKPLTVVQVSAERASRLFQLVTMVAFGGAISAGVASILFARLAAISSSIATYLPR